MDKGNVVISVLMTAYNREAFIEEAILSVVNTSYSNYELIIVDDQSTDNTLAIAKKYEALYPQIRVYRNKENLGDYGNRNMAASYAKGKYIKYCDSDDKLYPWTLDYCIDTMKKYPNAGIGFVNLKNDIKEDCLLPSQSIYLNFFNSTILNIGPSGTIINREKFMKAGMFKADYGTASDMYFNLKMANLFPIVLLKKDFFFYRSHDGQEFNNRYSYLLYNYSYLLDAFALPGFPLNEKQKKYLLRRQGFWYLKDFLVYIKKTGKIKYAFKAVVQSGIKFKDLLIAIYDVVTIKLKIKPDFNS